MTTQNALEQTLLTHGDELYQTALLLTLDPKQAEATVLRAVRALIAQPPTTPGVMPILVALCAALPAKHRPANRSLWDNDANASVLNQIAALPLNQRLALDLLLRRDYEPQQVAPLFHHDPAQAKQALYNGLLALAPMLEPNLPLDLLNGAGAPETCQRTRFMLATSSGALFDRDVRAHLATCAACRSAEYAWGRIRSGIERTMHSAFRTTELPTATAERIRAMFTPTRSVPLMQRLLTPHVLQIALPLVVLLAVALLVLPRPTQPSAVGVQAPNNRTPPRELVEQAQATLYRPLGQSNWHGRYEIRWNFSNQLYAMLAGDLWTDSDPLRFRAQLTHRDGGAPYEFLLSGRNSLWYANTELYGRSMYGALYDQFPNQVEMTLPLEQQAEVFRARLESGAWSLPYTYLRQALAAEELSTWGNQRGADGREQTVVGFSGTSPLGFAPDVPGVVIPSSTILLTIDRASGQLREIREVSGPAGGELVGRTVWRQILDESIEQEQFSNLFTISQAYNGTGGFQKVEESGLADPALPMVPASAVRPPTDMIETSALPGQAPPGIDHALVLRAGLYEEPQIVYLGSGRLLLVSLRNGGLMRNLFPNLADDQNEMLTQNERAILLSPGSTFRYGAQVQYTPPYQGERGTIQIEAFGFTRAEIITTTATIGAFDIDQYIATAALYRTPQPHDAAARDTLLAALQTAPLAENEARRITVEQWIRQGPLVDTLHDPYHRPYYADGGPSTTTEHWSRRVNNRIEFASQIRNSQGEVIQQSLESKDRNYWFSAANSSLLVYQSPEPPAREPIIDPTWSVINLLGCGGTSMTTEPDGTRIVSQIDEDWYNASCNRQRYAELLFAQHGNTGLDDLSLPQPPDPLFDQDASPDEGPYLLDLANKPLYHRIFIDANGKATRYEVRESSPEGELVESIEIREDVRLPAADLATDVFTAPPPKALTQNNYLPNAPIVIGSTQEVTFTDVISRLATPIWYLPPNNQTELRRILSSTPASRNIVAPANIFDSAYTLGLAVQFVYSPPVSDTNQLAQNLFVGGAKTFGAFLRTRREWVMSAPATFEIDGRIIEGWRVFLQDNTSWTLLELDGTLLAIDTSTDARLALVSDLRRYQP